MIPITKPLLGEAKIDAVAAFLRSGMITEEERVAEFEGDCSGVVETNWLLSNHISKSIWLGWDE